MSLLPALNKTAISRSRKASNRVAAEPHGLGCLAPEAKVRLLGPGARCASSAGERSSRYRGLVCASAASGLRPLRNLPLPGAQARPGTFADISWLQQNGHRFPMPATCRRSCDNRCIVRCVRDAQPADRSGTICGQRIRRPVSDEVEGLVGIRQRECRLGSPLEFVHERRDQARARQPPSVREPEGRPITGRPDSRGRQPLLDNPHRTGTRSRPRALAVRAKNW